MYTRTTRLIKVTVRPQFLAEESRPAQGRYVWAYTIEIVNMGPETVQLRSRAWQITDEAGRREEVRGPGVIGQQPVLDPGERFEYTSGCPLTTPSGMMVGSYQMVADSGETFDIDIPAFSLDSPYVKRTVN
jgi:ApaG protein